MDVDSGLVHTVRGTAGHVADVTKGNSLLHGQESVVYADAGYQGAERRADAKPEVSVFESREIALNEQKGANAL